MLLLGNSTFFPLPSKDQNSASYLFVPNATIESGKESMINIDLRVIFSFILMNLI